MVCPLLRERIRQAREASDSHSALGATARQNEGSDVRNSLTNRCRDRIPPEDETMSQFFHGCRRKVGCVTLVMACVFVAGWVRSIEKLDIYYPLQTRLTRLQLSSNSGQCGVNVLSYTDDPSDSDDFDFTFKTYRASKDYDSFRFRGALWRLRFGGFDCGQTSDDIGFQTICIVPYWSVVLPPTAASAFLLLSEPRPVTKPTEFP